MSRSISIFLLLLIAINNFSQDFGLNAIDQNNSVTSFLETIAETTEEDMDYEEIFATMEELKEYPININSTNEGELKQIFFLDEYRISSLLEFISNYGCIQTIYEFTAIEGFDNDLIREIIPYIKIEAINPDKDFMLKELFKDSKNQFFIRYQRILEKQRGYGLEKDSLLAVGSNQYFLGSPSGLYLRYSYNFRNIIKAGFTIDKDPGEEFFGGYRKSGFDFFSAHLFLQNLGRIKSLVIGDYKLAFGQGIALSSGLGFGKSSDAVNIKRYNHDILAYSSTNESSLFRGLAAKISLAKKIDISLFFSSKKRDANIIITDSTGAKKIFTSLSESGYHRTIGEMDDKNSIREIMYGLNTAYRSKKFKTDITYYSTKFNIPLEPDSEPYNKFHLRGKENRIVSISCNYLFKHFNIFGEAAHNHKGGYAILNGIIASLSPRFTFSLIYRNYTRDYNCIYCNGIAESGNLSNEKGIYFGIVSSIHKKLKLSAFADIFTFPWLKYSVDAPSGGSEILIQLEYNHSHKAFMYLRYKNKIRQQNQSNEIIDKIDNHFKQYLRYHIEYSVSNNVLLKNRIELQYFKNEHSDSKRPSVLFYQDLIFIPSNHQFRFVFRYALFDSDSYNTRIYAYENDVLYSYSVPAYYDKGYRYFFLIKASLFRNLDFWIRFARTRYTNRDSIGSGPGFIEGSAKSEIKVMLRVKF